MFNLTSTIQKSIFYRAVVRRSCCEFKRLPVLRMSFVVVVVVFFRGACLFFFLLSLFCCFSYRCESDKNKELRALMEADFAAMDAEDGDHPCPKGKGDKCTCSPEEKRKAAEQKDGCQEVRTGFRFILRYCSSRITSMGVSVCKSVCLPVSTCRYAYVVYALDEAWTYGYFMR